MVGIDYGRGVTNIDPSTGIRYGVIHANTVGQSWYDDSESNYGEPTCPTCGNVALPSDSDDLPEDVSDLDWFDGKDYVCLDCCACFWSDSAFGEEPIAHTFKDAEYEAEQSGSDCDIFVTRSPYYTLCAFCSPCAPGAGYLTSQDPNGIKAYCFGPDWFEDGKAPYAVYRVADNVLVYTPEKD